MEVKAIHRYARISDQKARQVTRAITGMPVSKAISVLNFTPKKAAFLIGKVLRSAVANAEQRELGDSESMRVSQAYVDCGPTYKRFHARAMGRAASIHKRTSHITVVVEAPDSDARK